MNVKELISRLADCDGYDEIIVTVDGKPFDFEVRANGYFVDEFGELHESEEAAALHQNGDLAYPVVVIEAD